MKNIQLNDYSNLELNTKDMKSTLAYFSDVLALPLVSIKWADQSKAAVRAVMQLNKNSMISFLCTLRTSDVIELGVTHSINAGDSTTAGTLQHNALNVDSLEDLLAMRDRIRSCGVHCVGPMDHGFCQSIYFVGPDETALEISTLTTNNIREWIEPSTVEAAGVTKEEMKKLLGGD
ncbi:VOC family protein [Colwellia sp. 20A7]|uniref:VOC family protein n=1 Tax=Colwellia sp. 20A7 TaxID=2689569 RepID=UPI001358601C|nr:VOC family protein [Colwellia sp. 20A7]